MRKSSENNTLPKNATVIKTIVTTEMIKVLAEKYGVQVKDVLTGFKYIGEQIKLFEDEHDEKRFISQNIWPSIYLAHHVIDVFTNFSINRLFIFKRCNWW